MLLLSVRSPFSLSQFSIMLSYQRPSMKQDLGVVGMRPTSFSTRTPRERPVTSADGTPSPSSEDKDKGARSRSGSAVKSTEKLLVSLNESCPPIANASAVNLSVERSMSVGNYARPSLIKGLKFCKFLISLKTFGGPINAFE